MPEPKNGTKNQTVITLSLKLVQVNNKKIKSGGKT